MRRTPTSVKPFVRHHNDFAPFFLCRSEMVRKYMGEARVAEITAAADAGANHCEARFAERACPWHPQTSKRIVAKLILNSDLDLGTLATMAVQGAKAFT